jgi:sugar phosphate isomerase/epimerase
MFDTQLTRRQFHARLAGAFAATSFAPLFAAGSAEPFALRYILGSCMYGTTALAEILPEVSKTGAQHIDVWPRVHGNQREQMDDMGHDAFAKLLVENHVRLGMLTRYDLGPFGLQEEMDVAQKFGAKIIVTGSGGPKGLEGDELKAAVKQFLEKMKPHVAAAEEHEVIIGIENHSNSLIQSPDSLRWFAEMNDSPHIGIALAPYHLPDDAQVVAQLIQDLGPHLAHFYAWQHGMGCHQKLPKDQELMQLPGRGTLDFTPIVAALKNIAYAGWVEIFMHPVPRGIPILDTTVQVTAEINRSRKYLEMCLNSDE